MITKDCHQDLAITCSTEKRLFRGRFLWYLERIRERVTFHNPSPVHSSSVPIDLSAVVRSPLSALRYHMVGDPVASRPSHLWIRTYLAKPSPLTLNAQPERDMVFDDIQGREAEKFGFGPEKAVELHNY